MDKTWSKSNLMEIIAIYHLNILDPKDYNKSQLSGLITDCLKEQEIEWSQEYPDIDDSEDLLTLLQNPKDNFELNYKEKQQMIQKAKQILHYCRNGFVLSGSNYLSVEQIYNEGLFIAEHCDIPTCRRAISELNSDNKIRERIEMKISKKVKKDLENKKISKDLLSNKVELKRGFYKISFD
tara:strand:+ start:204 stop:746 length:543 start_codon:yes stop_codon:yes gene_type:complete